MASNYALVSKSAPLKLQDEAHAPSLRSELTSLYESYAELYPNPQLVREQHERDQLLRQVAAEQEQPPRKKSRGLFGFLRRRKEQQPEEAQLSTRFNQEELLEYHDGTQHLDTECIPPEATCAARFHLASVRTRRDLPNVVRCKDSSVVLVDIGVVAELDGTDPVVTHTSDREFLQDTVHDLSNARAGMVGPNLLAVSWGLADGVMMFYTRMAFPGTLVGWDCVAILSPTAAVLEHLQKSELLAHHEGSSKLLSVTDIVPLLVEDPNHHESSVATLAVSRLGGYIELVLLPSQLWLGDVLTPQNHKFAPRKRRRKEQPYGKLPDLSATVTTALTTLDYHEDVQCLEAYRTQVGSDAEWDTTVFPDNPPAEYILVASGEGNNGEMVSFWSVSTVFSEEAEASLHVAFVHAVNLGRVGADVSVFASDTIFNYWRRARRVRLRQGNDERDTAPRKKDDVSDSSNSGLQASALSTPAPIIRMRFTTLTNVHEGQQYPCVLLAVLDWNGGVTIVDCTTAIRVASHDVPVHELDDAPLSHVVSHRSISLCRDDFQGPPTVDIGWLGVENDLQNATLVTIKPCIMQVWKYPMVQRPDEEGTIGQLSSTLKVPFMSKGAAVVVEGDQSRSLTFLTLRKEKDKTRSLHHVALQQLAPSKVIEKLVESLKYAEAISAGKAMKVSCSEETIQLCHRQLWEQDGSVIDLGAVTDDVYVVKQALALFTASSQIAIDTAVARKACYIAIERLDRTHVPTTLKLGGLEEAGAMRIKLEEFAKTVSTYDLLCKCLHARPSFVAFREEFLQLSLRSLASTFASVGNSSALTVLLFRHRQSLLKFQLEILDHIPLGTPTALFSHLLPVFTPQGDGKEHFCTGVEKDKELCHWSTMADYMLATTGTQMLLDDMDKQAVIGGKDACGSDDVDVKDSLLPSWYLKRAHLILHDIGRVSFLREFCECAVTRLGATSSARSNEEVITEVSKLHSLRNLAILLDEMSVSRITASTLESLASNALASTTLSDLQKMSGEARFSLLMASSNDPRGMLSKLRTDRTYLALVEGLVGQGIDTAVAEYCRKEVLSKLVVDGSGIERQDLRHVNHIRNAFGVLTAITSLSRSTTQLSRRLIKDKKVLTNLVIDAACNTSRACKYIRLLPTDCRHLLGSLWECYECLPVRLAPGEESQQEAISAQKGADRLFRHLVVVDILSQWAPDTALRYLVDLREADEPATSSEYDVRKAILSEIFRSFCHQVGSNVSSGAQEDEERLCQALKSDVDQLEQVGFGLSRSSASSLRDYLVKTLLRQGNFRAIRQLADWIGSDQVQTEVLSFVKAAMFNDEEPLPCTDTSRMSASRFRAASECQDILGPLFPTLREKLHSIRRYLDAANFVNALLHRCGNADIIYPYDVRDKPPLDIIETVLAKSSKCILDGCQDWANLSFARSANEIICRHYWRMRQRDANASPLRQDSNLPPLPGSSLYRLASKLGIGDQRSILVVKARVVHHSILGTYYDAAAAVCTTMIHECPSGWNDAAEVQCVMSAVAEVVSLERYDDLVMKAVLCNGVFEHYKGNMSLSSSTSFETILASFISVEHIFGSSRSQERSVSSMEPTEQGTTSSSPTPEKSDFLVFRAAGLVARTAKSVVKQSHQAGPDAHHRSSGSKGSPPGLIERLFHDLMTCYSTDALDLFLALRGEATNRHGDDRPLISLGRLTAFCSIADALRIRPQLSPQEPARTDFDDVLALWVSLLLHSQDLKALSSCLQELQEIIDRETPRAMEQAAFYAGPSVMVPDPEIVNTLISRGYSENGARRAAIMTGNENSEVALVWAVSHTLDADFDDPMVILAAPNGSVTPALIDQNMVHRLQLIMRFASNYASGKQSLLSLLPARVREETKVSVAPVQRPKGHLDSYTTDRSGLGTNGSTIEHRHKAADPGRHLQSDKSSRRTRGLAPGNPITKETNQALSSRSTFAIEETVSRTQATAATVHVKNGIDEHAMAETKLSAAAALNPTSGRRSLRAIGSKPVPSAGLQTRHAEQLPSMSRNVGREESKVAGPSGARGASASSYKFTSFASSGAKASSTSSTLGRPSLRTQRHLPKQDMKTSPTTSLASNERKRLVTEGRRLLEQARASRSATASGSETKRRSVSSNKEVKRYRPRSAGAGIANRSDRSTLSNTAEAADLGSSTNAAADDEGGSSGGWDFDDFDENF